MKRQITMQAHQLVPFARFLEQHPSFSPLLIGDDALVCGFQVGLSYLGLAAMETIVANPPNLVAQATPSLAPSAAWHKPSEGNRK